MVSQAATNKLKNQNMYVVKNNTCLKAKSEALVSITRPSNPQHLKQRVPAAHQVSPYVVTDKVTNW